MKYDFIEIGTSDFETCIETATDQTVGISVEPLRYYLDKLPNKANVKKICAIISDDPEPADVYYVPDDDITSNNLPYWLRGCNTVGDYHLQHKLLKVQHLVKTEKVQSISLSKLFHDHEVTELDLLKLDTEGSDWKILLSFYPWAVDKNILPNQILFESNGLTDPKILKSVLDLYGSHYAVKYTGENTLLEKKGHKINIIGNKMRFHILGLPHTVTSKEYNACAYTQKVLKFGKMMKDRGHTIIHYGHEESSLVCDEHVTVLTADDWKKAYGDYDWRKHFFKFDTGDYAYQTFYKNAIREVGLRKEKYDFILPFWGSGVRPICDAHPDLICVEPGIGYAGGHWARWKIFESYAIYHAYYGLDAVGTCKQDWYDAVIPNYFDVEDFEFAPEKKEDYYLFIGRVYEGKGVHIAVQVTEAIGAKLLVAGQNPDNMSFPPHVEFTGYANTEKRKQLMSRAKAAFVPSMYVEPFGGVQVECLMSGTPTITTDWGSFTENNIHGLTGYRCRNFEQFCWAAKNIDRIDPQVCRDFAVKNFGFDRVGNMYEEFFQMVLDVYQDKGWYQPRPNRAELDWLKKTIPVPFNSKSE